MHTQAKPIPARTRIADDFDTQIHREWLLTNGRGGFASGTVLGIPTRRYHGLLIASARPPLERWLLLSAVLEKVRVAEQEYELTSFAFDQTIHPRGFTLQTHFDVSNAAPEPWAQFMYEHEEMRLTRLIVLPRGSDEVRIHYRLEGPPGVPLLLEICPFAAMRDFHALTRAFHPGFPVEAIGHAVAVDAYLGGPRLWLQAERTDGGSPVVFESRPDWWYGFVYREEAARGHDHLEDLFVPGWFRTEGRNCIEAVLRGVAEFGGRRKALPGGSSPRVELPRETPHATVEERLCEAADAFVVSRRRADGTDSTTILAGYHWFGDWGRDTFIALPGLLLETGRFQEAREVLATFAAAQRDGLIPNRFSDYGDGCDYNSVDASLWFIHAADGYRRASGDQEGWDALLRPACERIIEAFLAGTDFDIRADEDGLLWCGDAATQLTWMDAKFGDQVFTPRHGKPVEINVLWHHALCLLGQGPDAGQAGWYRELAETANRSFSELFWNEDERCLYDVVRDGFRDPAIRPNQIFAVSLPHSPLAEGRQRAVLDCVERHLLTPYGLRSLSPADPAYRPRCEGNPYQRDSAYHQGTVWAWLIGPYVEAYLRVHEFRPEAKAAARARLVPLIGHLDAGGIGSISEIFNGDPPHTPGGCIAQAWSVAELLRAWRMTAADVEPSAHGG
jgi:glycogen debranching enzyme